MIRFLTINFMKTISFDTPQIKLILDTVFASVYGLYWQTHSCHWNIRAEDFYSLHIMLEEQYTTLWKSLDEIAERYRVFDLTAPTESIAADATFSTSPRKTLLTGLLNAGTATIDVLRQAIDDLDALGDVAGADVLTGMLAQHEKHAWMIKSSI